MRSTAEWEAALKGTTPGPWEAKQYSHEWVVTPATAHPVTHDVGSEDYGNLRYVADVYGEENANLIAVAPEAVAELIAEKDENERLRRELEELQRLLNVRAGNLQAARQYVAATGSREAATRIGRILKGTHE